MSTTPLESALVSRAKYIYKILPSSPPSPLPATTFLPLSALDARDGYIHLSTAAQVPRTASLFFAESTQLWLLKIKVEVLDGTQASGSGEIRWEPASPESGGDLFPHLYGGGLGAQVVDEVLAFRREGGQTWTHVLGELEA